MPAGADPQRLHESPALADVSRADAFLVHRFEHYAATTPTAIAVRFGSSAFSYSQLNAMANRIAVRLINAGVEQGGRVAIALAPSVEMVAAVAGIMKAGAAYVPLDPAYPSERLQAVVEQAQPCLAISSATLNGIHCFPELTTLMVEDLLRADSTEVPGNPGIRLQPDDLCYLMFTSGSTGTPNGVMVSHGNLAGLFANVQPELGFDSADRWSAMHSFAFGFSVWEIWGALSSGATLVIVPDYMRGDPVAWSQLLVDEAVSVLSITPSAFRQWLLTASLPEVDALGRLRLIVFSGEAVRPDDLANWFARFGDAGPLLANTYALTETAGRITVKLYTPEDFRPAASAAAMAWELTEPGNIGTPAADADVFVLDRATGTALAAGQIGELVIGGPMVAHGYFNNPELTVRHFVDLDPGDGVVRCYRTGDRAQWNADGTLTFVGRIDDQVKLRGYRIELHDVEQSLRSYTGVADAAVVLDDDGLAPQLVAWVVPAQVQDAAVEFWPSLGEYQVYDELLYDFMSADEIRVDSYRRAFARHVKGKVVLDIGTGKDAVLARLCAAAGARKVYAIEVLEDACASARNLIADLGLADRIEVIQGDMQSVVLPEPVSVCTQGIVGNIGSSDGIPTIWNDARHSFADDYVAIPSLCETLIAPAQLPDATRAAPGFSPLAAAYADKIFAAAGAPFDVRLCVRNFPEDGLLAAPTVFESLNFQSELPTAYSGQADFVVEKTGLFDGFLLWTRIRTDEQDTVDFLQHQQAWLPVWFPVADTPLPVEEGDVVQARWRCATPAGQIFPDYFVEVEVRPRSAAAPPPKLTYSSRHFEDAHLSTELHRRIFSADAPVGDPAGLAGLRSWAADQLPAQMVPARWELIERLPLNANGKLDRRALQALAARRGRSAPDNDNVYTDPLERDIAAIWCEVLGRPTIAPDADFFEAGGDSILAVRLTTEVQRYLDDTVFLAALFDAPTVVTYAAWLTDNHAAAVAKRLGANDKRAAPAGGMSPSNDVAATVLSWPQQSLWFLQQLYPGSTGANEQFLIRVAGGADPDQLRRAWRIVLADHDVLRTRFVGAAEQVEDHVAELSDCIFSDQTPCEDVAGLSTAVAEERLCAAALGDIAVPFDLAIAPLLRTRIFRMPGDELVLLVTAHHIIADGLCVPLIRDALAAAWQGQQHKRPELQYADFARWQRQMLTESVIEGELTWWRQQLAGHAGQPLADIRSAGNPGTKLNTREVRLPFVIDAELADQLRSLAAAAGATPFMLLLAAWRVWLRRCYSETDLLIGSPVTLRRDEATAGMLGCMVNNVVFRNLLADGSSFTAVLQSERQAALATYDHCELPFEKIVEAMQPERHFGRHPLFQMMFMFEDRSAPPVEVNELSFAVDVLPVYRSSYWDMELSVTDCGAGKEMGAFIGAREDLFDVHALEWWPEGFVAMLAAIAADPDADVSALPLLSKGQRQTVLDTWNDTCVPMRPEQTLHGLVAEQCLRTPDATAATDSVETLSYAQLNIRAENYAAALAHQGIGPGQRVGLCMERSVDSIALLLAVLKRGAMWLPLDPGYPQVRLKQMLAVAQPDIVLGDGRAPLPDSAIVMSGAELLAAAAPISSVAPVSCDSSAGAYILFTSGSTGVPKGVVSNHAGAISRCQWMWREYAFAGTDIFAQRTSMNFVDAIWEIFGALMHGAQVAVLPARLEHDPAGIADWLSVQRVSHFVAVPSLLAALLETDGSEAAARTLHTVISSGEALSPALARRLQNRWPGCRLLNTYGTSETWDGSCYEVPDELADNDRVPVGTPVANAELYVLDANRQPLLPGARGELYVGGLGLAQGYLGNVELTQERFLSNPFVADDSARIYRTGDLARYRGNGDVELLGRVDRQIKLRGLRIEAGEIESLASCWPGVSTCALALREHHKTDSWLALFVVVNTNLGSAPDAELSSDLNNEFDIDGLRAYLQENLPRAMVPADIVVLDSLPLTPSGKLDLQALPVASGPDKTASGYVAPRNQTEQQLVEIWEAALGIERVGVRDDFFVLRGHSLLATKVIARICDACGVELPLQSMFETPTVAGLARSIDALRWTQADGTRGDSANDEEREVLRL